MVYVVGLVLSLLWGWWSMNDACQPGSMEPAFFSFIIGYGSALYAVVFFGGNEQ